MYLSRIILDGRKHKTAQAIYNRGILHGAIERCFEGKRKKNLWRLDQNGSNIFLMMVSEDKPSFDSFCEQFAINGMQAEIKQYDPYIDGLQNGDVLRFRLTANPTIKKDKKRIPLNRERTKNQSYCAADWLIDRMKNNGAEVQMVQISKYDNYKISYNGKKITLAEAIYDGSLKITDISLFSSAVRNGIGHGKAYGCGLLTVMK